jgi:hypothetical protein
LALEGAPADAVLDALADFQNPDGGFGRALEPDFRLPASSPMASMVAFDLLREVGARKDAELVKRGLAYLADTWDSALGGWQDVPEEVNDHPHAPWWHHEPERRFGPQGHWAMPGAQITAALWRHEDQVPASLLREASASGLSHLEQTGEPLREYVALGYHVLARATSDRELAARIAARVLRDAPHAVSREPEQWKVEPFQPCWLVREARDPLAEPLRDVLEANLDFALDRQSEVGCWEPNWIWFGQPASAFEPARRDWSSEQTALLLRVLSGHDRFPVEG